MPARKHICRYYGGKSRLVPELISLLAPPPYARTYIEGFGGGATLLLNKPAHPVEVLNDLNGDLVNLYTVIRDERLLEKFLLHLELTPYSRLEFERARSETEDPIQNIPDPVRAARYYVVLQQSYGGGGAINPSWSFTRRISRRGVSQCVSAWLTRIENLRDIHERLRGVQIERADILDLIQRYDSPDAVFYLDPPYITDEAIEAPYAITMGADQHKDFLNAIINCRAKVLVSNFQSHMYDVLIGHGFYRLRIGSTTTGKPEMVWLNYPSLVEESIRAIEEKVPQTED